MLKANFQRNSAHIPPNKPPIVTRNIPEHNSFDLSRKNSKSCVLLLQGPVGPFFKNLQKHLIKKDFDVWRVCFNAGDMIFSTRKQRIRFFAGEQEWRSRLEEMLSVGHFDSIILFGSERKAHRIARELADQYGVRVISLEEGYIRSGYITVEESGNNASSPIAGKLPGPMCDASEANTTVNGLNTIRQLSTYGAIYFTIRGLFGGGRQRQLFHRSVPLLSESFFWTRNLLRYVCNRNRCSATIQNLVEHWDGRYYLIALQVAADANMQSAALGWNSSRLISESIKSFARSAPSDRRIVFKIHPMERGHNNLLSLIFSTAEAHDVSERVDIIECGSIGHLAHHCAGMITINSSSGFSAIFHGVPLMTLGEAVYTHPELVICAKGKPDFDAFWTSDHVADANTRKTYIAWVKKSALKPGDFYSQQGMETACEAVLSKIEEQNLLHSPKNIK